jgi:hypothetical protein
MIPLISNATRNKGPLLRSVNCLTMIMTETKISSLFAIAHVKMGTTADDKEKHVASLQQPVNAKLSLYVQPGLTFTNSIFCPHSACMCFVRISIQTAIISLYDIIWLVIITEMECVYCAVRAGSLNIIQVDYHSTNALYLFSCKCCSY